MDEVTKYIFEAGMLKRIARSGWLSENIRLPESVADHSFRTAVIVFMLAKMEGLDDAKAKGLCTAAVFHDMHETRILDLNKITRRYINVDHEVEKTVELEQVKNLPPGIRQAMVDVLVLSPNEKEILKDADQLECAFQAKEYAAIGYQTEIWIDNIGKRLKTKSAKKIMEKLRSQDPKEWLKGLKKLD